MTTKEKRVRIPCFLLPFWWLWRLIALIVALTGRLVAVVLGSALMLVGFILCITLLGLPIGIPMIVMGLLLVLRGIF